MSIHGQYYDGQTAVSHAIQIELDNQGMLHAYPDVMPPMAITTVKISSRIGNIPRTLTFPSGAVFETDDHDTLDRWLTHHQLKKGVLHKLESSMQYVMGAVIFMALFVAWTAFYGIPMLSSVAANALPAQLSIAIGDGVLETMDERFFSATALDEQLQQKLTAQFMQLLPDPENKGDIKYTLEFRKGGLIGANAFALPNGTVVLTDELVALADHHEEIYSVLLHEVGHVEHRHSLRQVISHSGLAILTVLITGDINSAGALVLAMPNILMSSAYSRDIEWEADTYALEHMAAKGIPFSRFADFMEKLEANVFGDEAEQSKDCSDIMFDKPSNEDGNSTVDQDLDGVQPACDSADKDEDVIDIGFFDYISSHPPTEERIARFRDFVTD
ncbi:MAG: metalloprotease [Methylophaga sp.]|nr:MAG: metalloprotease [Methylophaga sp.]